MERGEAITTRYHLELSFIVSNYGSTEALEAHLDCAADYLVELQGVVDPDMGANLADAIVTFTMSVDAETSPEALWFALAGIQAKRRLASLPLPLSYE